MNIKNVSICNFLIVGQADVSLSNRGLCRIAGENSDDSTSSSNGAGKSSIIEAVYWALFGETLRNVRSADGVVNNRVQKDCSVVVDLEEGGTTYRIERYRKHTKHKNNLYLYINDVDSRGKDNRETQNYIESVIGMDKMAFANSVIFGQGHSKNLKRFSEMTDSEKKETLEKILNLDAYAKAYDVVRSTMKEDAEKHEQLLAKGEDLRQRASLVEDRVADALKKAQQFSAQKSLSVQAAQARRDLTEEQVTNLKSRISSLSVEDTEDVREIVSACEEFIISERERKSQLSDSFMERRNKELLIKGSIEKDVSAKKAKLVNLFDPEHVGETCEFCGSMVKEDNLVLAKDGLQFDVEDLSRSLKSVSTGIDKLTKAYKKRARLIDDSISEGKSLLDAQRDHLRAVAEIANKRTQLEYKLSAQEDLLTTYDEALETASATVNVWEDTAEQYASDLEKLLVASIEVDEALEKSQASLKYYEFWKTAFSRKGIRSYLLDKIVPFLNERVGHYLNILTEGGIEAKFHTTKQLASGEYRDNFNLEITNRNAADTYEGNSGGEKRRIDLGVALGFNDFLAARSGKRFNILLLDEVFEGIDEDGLYYVIKVLEDIARRKSSVLVITHRDELKSYFSDEILIKRHDGLSNIWN